jgi:hypothetical protein
MVLTDIEIYFQRTLIETLEYWLKIKERDGMQYVILS